MKSRFAWMILGTFALLAPTSFAQVGGGDSASGVGQQLQEKTEEGPRADAPVKSIEAGTQMTIPDVNSIPTHSDGFGPITGPGISGADRPLFLGSVGSPSLPTSMIETAPSQALTQYGPESSYMFIMSIAFLALGGIPFALMVLGIFGRFPKIPERPSVLLLEDHHEPEEKRAA